VISKNRMPGKEQARGTDEFGLFAAVHREAGVDEAPLAAGPHLDECETRAVEHHEVDLAAACPEVPGDRGQPLVAQESKGALFSSLA
jgi:hypothetical protein